MRVERKNKTLPSESRILLDDERGIEIYSLDGRAYSNTEVGHASRHQSHLLVQQVS